MCTLVKSWQCVTQQTITNCYMKCGFAIKDSMDLDENEDPDDDIPLSMLSAKLKNHGVDIETNDLEVWVNSDNRLAATASPSNEDIIAGIISETPSDNNDHEDPQDSPLKRPTRKQQKQAYEILRTAILFTEGTDMLEKLNSVKRHLDRENVRRYNRTRFFQ